MKSPSNQHPKAELGLFQRDFAELGKWFQEKGVCCLPAAQRGAGRSRAAGVTSKSPAAQSFGQLKLWSWSPPLRSAHNHDWCAVHLFASASGTLAAINLQYGLISHRAELKTTPQISMATHVYQAINVQFWRGHSLMTQLTWQGGQGFCDSDQAGHVLNRRNTVGGEGRPLEFAWPRKEAAD